MKNDTAQQINSATRQPANRSFDNPMFGMTQSPKEDSSMTKTAVLQQNQLDANLLNALHKSTSNPSIKSNKSTKSFKSLLGFGKDNAYENPMVDLSVDIGSEASKFDPFDFQGPEEIKVDIPTSSTEIEGIAQTIF